MGDSAVMILLFLLFGNVVVDFVCRRPSPPPWAGSLCFLALVVNAVLLLIPLAVLMTSLSGNSEGLESLILLPGALVLIEVIWLLVLYYSRFRPPKLPPSA